jgi:hypothetical protein
VFFHFKFAPTPVSRRVDVGRQPVVKIIAESLSQHDEKHVVPTPLSGIRVGRSKFFHFKNNETYFLYRSLTISQFKIGGHRKLNSFDLPTRPVNELKNVCISHA